MCPHNDTGVGPIFMLRKIVFVPCSSFLVQVSRALEMGIEAIDRHQQADKRRAIETWKHVVLVRKIVTVQRTARYTKTTKQIRTPLHGRVYACSTNLHTCSFLNSPISRASERN